MKTAQTGQIPRVLFFGLPKHIESFLKLQLGKSLVPVFYSCSELENEQFNFDGESVHRIVIFPNVFADKNLFQSSRVLSRIGVGITIVFSFIPDYERQVGQDCDEDLISSWGLLRDKQQALYKQVVATFPTAQFLFYDGLSLIDQPTSLPCLLLSQIDKDLIFTLENPSQQISLIFEKDFCLSMVELIKKPFSSRAVLIRSESIKITVFVEKIKDIYQKLFFRQLKSVIYGVNILYDTPITSELVVLPRDKNLLGYSRLYGGGFFKTAATLRTMLAQPSNKNIKNNQNDQHYTPFFGQQISTLFSQVRNEQKQEHFSHIARVENKIGKKNNGRKVFFWGGILSACLATYMIFYMWMFYSAYQKYQANIIQLIQAQPDVSGLCGGGWEDIEKKGEFVRSTAKTWDKALSHPVFEHIKLAEQVMTKLSKFCDEQKVQDDEKRLIYHHILSQSNLDLTSLLDEYGQISENIASTKQDLFTSIENFNAIQQYEPSGGTLTRKGVNNADTEVNTKGLFQMFKPELKKILGFEEQKTYAFVFQDSAELRPTGGFISSVGFVNVRNGQLSSYYTKGAYEISRLVSGVVSPPPSLSKVLKEKNWYFHDSNWDPNFSQVGKTMSWFIEKATGVKLDGVVGITTANLRSILDTIGPIAVDEYNENITADNLGDVLDKYAKQGVDQSQKFTAALMKTAIGRIFAQNTDAFGLVVNLFIDQLNQKQIQVWFQDNQVQKTLTSVGWSGDASPVSCFTQFSTSSCLADAVYQVEANIGINRVGPKINTNTVDTIEFTRERLNHKRVTIWQNTTTSNVWPMGVYKAYVRWYLPKSALFADLVIDGQSRLGSDLELSYEGERLVVATTIEVGVGARLSAELNYYIGFENTAPLAYMYIDQAQVGQNQPEHQLSIVYPATWNLTKISPNPAEKLDGKLNFSLDHQSYGVVGVEFSSTDSQ